MFTIQFREEVREKLINKAKSDNRLVAAAVIGSYANDKVDRWSDIDLTFGVDELYTTDDLIYSWTEYIQKEFSGIVLFDVQRGKTKYRVFIVPGCLQVDLSFSPSSEFGAIGTGFKLLYGKQNEKPQPKATPSSEIFGLIVHHLLHARICVERERLWQAELWLSEARNYSLNLACRSGGLETGYGRAYDDLPVEILNLFKDSFIKELSSKEIMRCIKIVISVLPKVSEETKEQTAKVDEILIEIGNK